MHGEGYVSTRFMCIQQSRLDDIQQDICTEGEKLFFMSRRKGRYERRQAKREANKTKRCQEVGGLNDVFTYHDMFLSGRKCCNGVRWKNSAQRFELHLFSGTAARRREILEHKWKPSTIETASDNYDPYAVTDKAYAALIDLVTDICKRNGKTKIIWFGDKDTALSYNPAPNEMVMTVHRWFANKSCPGPYLYERQGEIAAEVNRRLSSEEEDEFMTSQEKFNEMFAVAMDEYRKRLRDNDSGSWSQEARDWSTSSGLIAGGGNMIDGTTNYMWEDFLTREQAAQLFYRFNQMK